MPADIAVKAEWLTVPEAARLLKVHHVTLLRWVREGRVPGVECLAGGRYRLPLEGVRALLQPANVSVRGEVPADLTERVSRMHA